MNFQKKKYLLPLSIILALSLIFFWKIPFLNETLFAGDMITLNYPFRIFVRECLKENIIPLWCPYLGYGFPLLAEGQSGIFYPLNILLFTLFNPTSAYNYSVILHFFLAGLFIFIYLQIIEIDTASSLFTSITFMFSGVFITHLTYFNYLSTYIWLPLILGFIELYFRRNNWVYLIFTGVILGIQILSGAPQISPQILLISLIYFLVVNKQGLSKAIFNLFIILLIGFGLAAIQLLPTYEFLKESSRSNFLEYEEWTVGSLSLLQLITFLLPNFYGNPFEGVYLGDWNYIDLCGYLGIMPLILGIVTVILRRDKYSFLFFGICLLGLLLAFGKYNPLYTLLSHIPIIGSLRIPSRYLYIYTVSISILAGMGFNYLLNVDKRAVQRWLKIIIFTAICFGLIGIYAVIDIQLGKVVDKDLLYSIRMKDWLLFIIMSLLSFSLLILYIKHKITPSIFIFLSITFLIINIFIYWIEFNPTVKKSVLTSMPESVNFLKKDTDLYRIATHDWKRKYKDPIARSRISKLSSFEGLITSFKESISPNLSVIYKIFSSDIFPGLALTRYEEFTKIQNLKLFSLSNGKYIITPKDVHSSYPLVFSNETVNIYENRYYLPRTFIVHQAKIIKDKEKILKELRSEDFKPVEYVILEEKPNQMIKKQINGIKEKAQIIKYSLTEVEVEVSLSQPGFLILTDTYYPGWEVYVNNKKEHIYRANYLFRAVCLNAGNFKIRFIYNPLSFNLGAIISLSTLIFTGLSICGNIYSRSK